MIHIVIGTKAQLIKMAPIMMELDQQKIYYNFIFTGQHKNTIDQLREIFRIKKPNLTLHHGKDITGIFQMVIWLSKICLKVVFQRKSIFPQKTKNDILLTHGDTFSTVLGALMGRLAGIKVAHIESGLRSFNIFHPFPEELNRLVTFKLSHYYFCPGDWALDNLKKFKGKKINTKTNTLYDALELAIKKSFSIEVNIPQKNYCIFSTHRFENIFNKKRLKEIISIIEKTAKEMTTLFILHPPTEKQLKKHKYFEKLASNHNIQLRPRYDYFQFIKLLENSQFIITDGGSNQEECYYLGKPCLLLRNKTERQEGIGKNVVLSHYKSRTIDKFLENQKKYKTKPIKVSVSPSKIIVNNIQNYA